jgi:hypothetical protein
MRASTLIKEPLVHFFIIATVLYWGLSFFSPPINQKQIQVTEATLLNYMQFNAKAFEPEVAAKMLGEMTNDERTLLINDYIRQEALYREAISLGLDQEDYVIRTRMVQKMEFIFGASSMENSIDMADLQSYYETHKQDYKTAPTATFTHVFLSTKNKPLSQVKRRSISLREQLNQKNIGFNEAVQYGDRFLYHTNYIDRSYDFTRSNFGAAIADKIFSENVHLEQWWGPEISEYGVHLIFVAKRSPSIIPTLSEVQSRVENDLTAERKQEFMEEATRALIEGYDIVISPDLKSR